MTTFQVVVSVMFGAYLMNFISGFVANFTESYATRLWLEAIIGAVLLYLVLSFN